MKDIDSMMSVWPWIMLGFSVMIGFLVYLAAPKDKRHLGVFFSSTICVWFLAIFSSMVTSIGTMGDMRSEANLKYDLKNHGPYQVVATSHKDEVPVVVVKDREGNLRAYQLTTPLPHGTKMITVSEHEEDVTLTEHRKITTIIPAPEEEKKK